MTKATEIAGLIIMPGMRKYKPTEYDKYYEEFQHVAYVSSYKTKTGVTLVCLETCVEVLDKKEETK